MDTAPEETEWSRPKPAVGNRRATQYARSTTCLSKLDEFLILSPMQEGVDGSRRHYKTNERSLQTLAPSLGRATRSCFIIWHFSRGDLGCVESSKAAQWNQSNSGPNTNIVLWKSPDAAPIAARIAIAGDYLPPSNLGVSSDAVVWQDTALPLAPLFQDVHATLSILSVRWRPLEFILPRQR